LAKKHPDIVRQMTATLETWRQSCRESAEGKDYGKSE
jgi:hypothetical protein